jgi:hypothetical protein
VKIMEERKAGARLSINSIDPDIIAGVLRRLITDGLPVTEFHQEQQNLEDAFIDMLGRIESGEVQPMDSTPRPAPLPLPPELPPGLPLPPPVPSLSSTDPARWGG